MSIGQISQCGWKLSLVNSMYCPIKTWKRSLFLAIQFSKIDISKHKARFLENARTLIRDQRAI